MSAVSFVLGVLLGVLVGAVARYRAQSRARRVEVAWRELQREVLALRAAGQFSLGEGWGCSCGAWGELRAGATEQERAAYRRVIEEHDAVCTPGDPL
ncbi:MAG TPA: hypothetical protein VGC57_16075 [Cellulomonas sp.]